MNLGARSSIWNPAEERDTVKTYVMWRFLGRISIGTLPIKDMLWPVPSCSITLKVSHYCTTFKGVIKLNYVVKWFYYILYSIFYICCHSRHPKWIANWNKTVATEYMLKIFGSGRCLLRRFSGSAREINKKQPAIKNASNVYWPSENFIPWNKILLSRNGKKCDAGNQTMIHAITGINHFENRTCAWVT